MMRRKPGAGPAQQRWRDVGIGTSSNSERSFDFSMMPDVSDPGQSEITRKSPAHRATRQVFAR
ncbi:hypothetical protein CBM2634_A110063 [Cupriavidus taiwanensis]|uniref:Uncharacterized protein n=1 Tax=Cupriavidus taiwanensis TaxID=164546 RepID=A0A375IYK3_9BURK|nr:hypothetical protein CBM2634_A110063 [Cupriavidus taiwanensis]